MERCAHKRASREASVREERRLLKYELGSARRRGIKMGVDPTQSKVYNPHKFQYVPHPTKIVKTLLESDLQESMLNARASYFGVI